MNFRFGRTFYISIMKIVKTRINFIFLLSGPNGRWNKRKKWTRLWINYVNKHNSSYTHLDVRLTVLKWIMLLAIYQNLFLFSSLLPYSSRSLSLSLSHPLCLYLFPNPTYSNAKKTENSRLNSCRFRLNLYALCGFCSLGLGQR